MTHPPPCAPAACSSSRARALCCAASTRSRLARFSSRSAARWWWPASRRRSSLVVPLGMPPGSMTTSSPIVVPACPFVPFSYQPADRPHGHPLTTIPQPDQSSHSIASISRASESSETSKSPVSTLVNVALCSSDISGCTKAMLPAPLSQPAHIEWCCCQVAYQRLVSCHQW